MNASRNESMTGLGWFLFIAGFGLGFAGIWWAPGWAFWVLLCSGIVLARMACTRLVAPIADGGDNRA